MSWDPIFNKFSDIITDSRYCPVEIKFGLIVHAHTDGYFDWCLIPIYSFDKWN